MGAALAQVVLGVERAARRAALQRRGGDARARRSCQEAHELLAASPLLDFVGNVEGTTSPPGVADVVVTDGFTGNVALKLIEGVSQTMLGAIRERGDRARRARSSAACCCGRRCAACATRSTPRGRAAPTCSGLRQLGVVPHGRFTRYGISQAILLAARGVAGDVVGRTHAALEAAGALRPKGPRRVVRRPVYGAEPAMTREEVFVPDPQSPRRRARRRPGADRRGDALQGGPRGRLARPLHARPGARGLLRREDARRGGGEDPHAWARRSTSSSPTPRTQPELCSSSATCSTSCPRTSPGRSSRTRRGPSAAPTPTRGWRSWATACSAWRSPRTCTRAWRPSATARAG